VSYPTGPLSPNALFGSSQGTDGDATFQFRGNASLFSDASTPERTAWLDAAGPIVLRSLVSSAPLEGTDRTLYNKPGFLFGDAAPDTDHQLLAGEGRWIFTMGADRYYIPSNVRHFPLSYFTNMTKGRKMTWRLTPQRESVVVGHLAARGANRAHRPAYVTGLLPGLMAKDVPAGEMPHMANTFINYFMAVGGNYPASDFRAPGWVLSGPNQW